MKKISLFLCLIAAMILSDCGGGGSKSSQYPRFDAGDNEILLFSIPSSKNSSSGITSDVSGIIGENTVTVIVPSGASLSPLITEFVTNSTNVTVNGIMQSSGVSANDFTSPVTYKVYNNNNEERDYVVTVTRAPDTEKSIVSYAINGIEGAINEEAGTISVILPPHSAVTTLPASFSSTGKSITVNGITQVNGETQNDFSSPLIYTVIAEDGSTRDYTVTVTVEKSSVNTITYFAFRQAENSALEADILGAISGSDILVVIPYGSSPGDLVAYFETEGDSVKIEDAVQESGITHNDFTDSRVYTVTAENGDIQEYTIYVSVAKSDAKAITSFYLDGEKGAINEAEHTIYILFSSSKNLSGLIAEYITTGVLVAVNGTGHVSGVTANDYSSPVIFTVTADNGTVQDYTVTAEKSPEIAGIWNFESGSDGTYTVSGATEVTGLTGTALQFDGTDDYVIVPDSDILTLADGGSIDVVLNVTSHSPYAGIVHKGVLIDFSDETYSLQYWGSDGTIRFSVNNTENEYVYVDSSTNLENNKWYHLVATWDSSHLAVYINGTLDSINETDIGEVKDSAGGLVIGAQLDKKFTTYSSWGNLGIQGIIDRVEISNYPLTAAEVEGLYDELAEAAGSGFAAYLISAAKHNIPYIASALVIVLTMLAVVYAYNRKRARAPQDPD